MNFIKVAKKLVIGAITAGSTMLIAACYGVYDQSYIVSGRVLNNGEGVENMNVCLNKDTNSYCVITDSQGYFTTDTYDDDFRVEGFQICVEDIDGPANGSIINECMDIPPNTSSPVDVTLNVHETN